MKLLDILFFLSLGLVMIFAGLRKFYLQYTYYQNKGYQLKDFLKYLFANIYFILTIILALSVAGIFRYINTPNVLSVLFISVPLVAYFGVAINVKNKTRPLSVNPFIKRLLILDIVLLLIATTTLVIFFKELGFFLGPLIYIGLQEVVWIVKYPFVLLIKKILEAKISQKISKSNVEVIIFKGEYKNILLKHFNNLTKNIYNNYYSSYIYQSDFAQILDLDLNFESYDYLLLEIKDDQSKIKKLFKNIILTITFKDSINNLDENIKYQIKKREYSHTDIIFNINNKTSELSINIIDEFSLKLILVVIDHLEKLQLNYQIDNLSSVVGYASVSTSDSIFTINASHYQTREAYESHLNSLTIYPFPKILITNSSLEYLTEELMFNINKFDLVYVINEKIAHSPKSKEYQELDDLNLVIKKDLAVVMEEINNQTHFSKPVVVLIENLSIYH